MKKLMVLELLFIFIISIMFLTSCKPECKVEENKVKLEEVDKYFDNLNIGHSFDRHQEMFKIQGVKIKRTEATTEFETLEVQYTCCTCNDGQAIQKMYKIKVDNFGKVVYIAKF